jgi:tetratricopeptide (TPR) repeat protein
MRGAVAALILLAAGVGRAAPDAAARAEAEMAAAERSFKAGDFPGAVAHYDKARALSPASTGPYLGLGLAWAALGRCDEATPALEEYLKRKARDRNPAAEATLNACKAARPAPPEEKDGEAQVLGVLGGVVGDGGVGGLGVRLDKPERRRGRLTLALAPSGAKLSVNGVDLGRRDKLDEDVAVGLYQVRAEAEGYQPLDRDLWVRADATTKETLTLARKPRVDAETRRKLGIGLGVSGALLVLGGAIALAVVFGAPPPPTRFSTVVLP